MKLDKNQQKVVDCDSNAVVSAGAGSGKTTVLARRFLRLIEQERAGVGEILTLTFTRKAAAEMYERIYGLLIENRDKTAAAAAVTDFDKASISTLDSFCSRIARDCSTSFGLPPTFATDESSVRSLAEEVSLDFILENADNDYLKEFIFINGFDNIWKNFFVHISLSYLALGAPVDFLKVFEAQITGAENALFKNAEQLDSFISDILSFEPVSKSIVSAQEQLRNLPSFRMLVADSDYRGLKAALSGVKLTKPGGRVTKTEVLSYKEIVDEFRSVASTVTELVGTLDQKELLEGLFKLTSSFQDELFNRKRSAGLLGFHDVLTIAVAGLKKDKELRKYYKSLFRYIMIDEFQDNNILQKELLYLLSEQDGLEGDGIPEAGALNREKLFFVGDEKQSIYRFRGADVSVFKQLSNELSEAGGTALALKCNYRSEPGLIDFFNTLFSSVMRDSEEDYQAAFEALDSRDAVLKEKPDIKLLYKPYIKDQPDDSLSSEESEARMIADYILSAVDRLEVAERGVSRPAAFSDFALLFRSGTNQKTYEQVFRARGVPYNVHSVRSLFQEAPVNDIYNFLQICIYPDDRSASAAFLRSPLINISDLSLVEFLLSGKKVFDEGQEDCCRTESDLTKYKRARELYNDINKRIDREPLEAIVSELWYRSGYRYLILRNSTLHGYLEYYDYLKQLAVLHDQGGKSTADFLDYIRENLGEYKKIDELKIMGYSAGGVEIMPVHQSKGLEFPIVILANAGNVGVNDRGGSSPAFISPVDGLSFNLISENDGHAASGGRCNYFYSRGKEENRAREEAELRRLLYVALTRAESHLVISGCHGRQNRSGERSMLNMFLRSFGWVDSADPLSCPDLEDYIDVIENLRWSVDGGLGGSSVDMPAVSSLYETASAEQYAFLPNEFSATALNALHRDAVLEAEPGAESGGGHFLPELNYRLEKLLSEKGFEADFGTITHKLIEWCIKNSAWDLMPDFENISIELRPFFMSFDDDDWSLMIKSSIELASAFFLSETWKIAAESRGFESELSFSAIREEGEDSIYVSGVIDLVFEMDDYIQIIDFKTDKKILRGEYDYQMQVYKDAASEIYSKPVRCSLFYLRGGSEIKV